jgi:two-component system nitrogen regulation response regulator NtrX
MALDVLIIDDEADIRDLISDILKDEGFIPHVAANSAQAFAQIANKVPAAIILDVWLQGSELDGLGILEIVKERYPLIPIIVISGHGTIETAVLAIKMGAYDYLEKPFTHEKLVITLKRACETAKLKRENTDLKLRVIDKTDLIGSSVAISRLKSEISKVAPTSGRVMITGGPGTGKELAARLIHKKSKRANSPFIVFSPTGLTAEKIQQELFGESEKQDSTFTKRLSVLEAANHGTLYIDEITDLPLIIQTKLLRFLQDQNFERMGTNQVTKLDVRLISASSSNIQNKVAQGKFRQDLFYRLNVVPINIASLEDRKEDVPLLASYFVKQLVKYSGLKERHLSDETIAALQAYNWPGNIRQLRNVIEWTLIMNPVHGEDNHIIKPEMLPSEILNNGMAIVRPDSNFDMISMPLREAREVFERQYLSAQMNRFNNNISKTSTFVGMERSALHRKLKLLNIHTSAKTKDGVNEDMLEDVEEDGDVTVSN